jgi:L-2,4-diaminobutyrate decarboxylase
MPPHLAGGVEGIGRLRSLLDTVLDALDQGAAARGGPLPAGGPEEVAQRVREACGEPVPDTGEGAEAALRTLVRALAEGAADPADPLCAAHLHAPPLAAAVAADLAVSTLNPSMDSWDQAPAATEIEAATVEALAALVFPGRPQADALVTTGGTESNQLGLLLARERHPAAPLQVVCGANAHHSIQRSAWVLGLPDPVVVPTPNGTLDPAAVAQALAGIYDPALVVATAGTTDTGAIDPLPELAQAAAAHGAELHIDAAYGGPLLLSHREAPKLHGLDRAASVTLDLHKIGWQPVAAGLLAVPDTAALHPLDHRADYLNAADDTEAGLPDLLGRSLRTTRRPDILKIAVTLKALGREGLGALVDTICDQAQLLADLVDQHPALDLYARPTISTVLFRPTGATDDHVASLRRRLMHQGRAVLGRATADGHLWLKVTLLNPRTRTKDLAALLALTTEGRTSR